MMQTVLIIDDDEAIGNLEQEVLERAGYAVLRAYSGTEARLLLKNERPDLILLDLMLPGLSGEELLPQLHGRRSAHRHSDVKTADLYLIMPNLCAKINDNSAQFMYKM